MATAIMIVADLVAITILSLVIYYTRHRRRDLVVAFFAVNVGVLAVTEILAASAVAVGLGLGLFGVLSIIRLRSDEISQREVSYYFASLALGLIAGLTPEFAPLPILLMALIVLTIFVIDHPALMARSRHLCVRVDRAIHDETELRVHLEHLLNGTLKQLTVQQLDIVNDTTLVDVRYQVATGARSRDVSVAR